MKYSININQLAAVELGNVDLVDVCIIDWLRDICISQSPKITSKRVKGHTWISYQHAIDDLPLLGLNSREAFRRRLASLIEKGYFTCIKQNQKVYVKPSTHVDSLYYNRQSTLTVPSTHVDSSTKRLTGVNRQPTLTNPYPNTKSYSGSGFLDKPAAKNESRGKPSPAKERIREMLKSGDLKGLKCT